MLGLGDLGGLLKNVRQMQQKIAETKATLEKLEVEGTSAGGKVVARVNGRSELLSLKIDPEVVDRQQVAALEDLILAAVQQAAAKAQEAMKLEMAKVTGGLNLPGMDNLLSGL